MESFRLSIEIRVTRGLERLGCHDIHVTHDGEGKMTLACSDRDANERALVIAATKTVPGVTDVRFQYGKPS